MFQSAETLSNYHYFNEKYNYLCENTLINLWQQWIYFGYGLLFPIVEIDLYDDL